MSICCKSWNEPNMLPERCFRRAIIEVQEAHKLLIHVSFEQYTDVDGHFAWRPATTPRGNFAEADSFKKANSIAYRWIARGVVL